jgi:hypothetical protein
MPKLSMKTQHALGQEEAVHRLQHGFSFVKSSFAAQLSDVSEQWDDNRLAFGFKAMGMKVSGNVVVEDSAVKLDADLPLAAIMFKGMIEQRIRQELDRLLK